MDNKDNKSEDYKIIRYIKTGKECIICDKQVEEKNVLMILKNKLEKCKCGVDIKSIIDLK